MEREERNGTGGTQWDGRNERETGESKGNKEIRVRTE